MGDEFCVAFATARDAIAAALDAQRALLGEDFSTVNGLRVRMAMHTGTADERDGDYLGPTVNRVARLLAIGHGGQVLVSGTTADLLRQELPAGTSLLDLGDRRLRGLAHPERIYQFVAPGLPQEFPPLLAIDAVRNNLPIQLTSFIGRDNVLADIKALIASHRLVTLSGTGGAGKTRCAIQAGAELLDDFGDGVWLTELAPIAESAFLANAIAQALAVQEQPDRAIVDTLLAYLKRKRLLLILDNCEHVIGEARRLATAILQHCPDVCIVATSRERLNVAGELVYRMPPLPVPDSIALFVERASSHGPFALTTENLPYVTEICRRLDGIPLAIELAAARVKVLSPKQLAHKLDERFRILTGGDPSGLARHQTMRALIDWSYDLLSEDERALFRKLSIFAGGFTLETAAAVCGAGDMDEIAVLDVLTSLVGKSLVNAEEIEGEGDARYRLSESTRQYAREKLGEAGEQDAAARAHARAFLTVAQRLNASWETTPDRLWYAQAEPELENFRAALSWAFGASGDALLGQRLAASRVGFDSAERRRWLNAAQQFTGDETPDTVRAALDLAQAKAAVDFQQPKATLKSAERALARLRKINDPLGIAEAQLCIARAHILLGDIAEGESLLEQSLEAFRSLGARRSAASALDNLAVARENRGDLPGARQRYSEALAAARSAGAERMAVNIAMDLAEAAFRGGDAAAALRLAPKGAALAPVFGNALTMARARYNTAAYLVSLARFDEARAAAREAVAPARDGQYAVGLAFTLQHLAAVAALRPSNPEVIEDRQRAARILGYVDAQLTALEALREYTEQQEYAVLLHVLGEALGAELATLMAQGSAWSEDRAVAEAMLV